MQPLASPHKKSKPVDTINQRDHEGRTPLMIKCSQNNISAVQELIQSEKLQVNLQDIESGYTALHKVVSFNQVFNGWPFIVGFNYFIKKGC